jgi:hypothetical protein
MNKKAPDTRNKLDSNKGLNTRKKPKKKSFRELKDTFEGKTKVKLTPKKTKGQIFKETHGYSRSISLAMRKSGIADLETYRLARKSRKKAAKKAEQAKKSASRGKKLASNAGKTKKKK